MPEIFKEIKNIQRFELLEDRFGIQISGITATITLEDIEDKYLVEINGEVTSTNGAELIKDFIQINVSLSDINGNILFTDQTYLVKAKFYGLTNISFLINSYNLKDLHLIKIYPTEM